MTLLRLPPEVSNFSTHDKARLSQYRRGLSSGFLSLVLLASEAARELPPVL